jgi:hypothetical protein
MKKPIALLWALASVAAGFTFASTYALYQAYSTESKPTSFPLFWVGSVGFAIVAWSMLVVGRRAGSLPEVQTNRERADNSNSPTTSRCPSSRASQPAGSLHGMWLTRTYSPTKFFVGE